MATSRDATADVVAQARDTDAAVVAALGKTSKNTTKWKVMIEPKRTSTYVQVTASKTGTSIRR